MLSTHLRLGFPSGIYPYGFPTNNLYTFLFSPVRVTCPAHPILLDLIILIILGEEYKSCSFFVHHSLHEMECVSPYFGHHAHEKNRVGIWCRIVQRIANRSEDVFTEISAIESRMDYSPRMYPIKMKNAVFWDI
jgi:hypothetical protein